jgi:hypothetical protein
VALAKTTQISDWEILSILILKRSYKKSSQ